MGDTSNNAPMTRSEKAQQLMRLKTEYRYLKAESMLRHYYSRWVKTLGVPAIRATWAGAKPWQRRFLACRLLDIDQPLIDELTEQQKSHYPDDPPKPSPELLNVLRAMQYQDMSFKTQSDAWGRLRDMQSREVSTLPGRIPSHELYQTGLARSLEKQGHSADADYWKRFGTAV